MIGWHFSFTKAINTLLLLINTLKTAKKSVKHGVALPRTPDPRVCLIRAQVHEGEDRDAWRAACPGHERQKKRTNIWGGAIISARQLRREGPGGIVNVNPISGGINSFPMAAEKTQACGDFWLRRGSGGTRQTPEEAEEPLAAEQSEENLSAAQAEQNAQRLGRSDRAGDTKTARFWRKLLNTRSALSCKGLWLPYS